MSFSESHFGGTEEAVVPSSGGSNGAIEVARAGVHAPELLGSPVVPVEAPLNSDGFRSDSPIQYGDGHVKSGHISPDDTHLGSEDGPGALHLNLPPIGAQEGAPTHATNRPPIGSLDGNSEDLYITSNRNNARNESPDVLRALRRAAELGSYQGEGDELQLPLRSAKETIHLRGPDTGVTHSA
ncbi:MAG: hypothetical protein WBO92_01960 [Candidatus Moraniibacteriota bacterium]